MRILLVQLHLLMWREAHIVSADVHAAMQQDRSLDGAAVVLQQALAGGKVELLRIQTRISWRSRASADFFMRSSTGQILLRAAWR